MKKVRLTSILGILLLAIILFSGCARSFNPDIERGSGYIFRDGYPEVRFSAIGFLDEGDNPEINVAADIVYGSLIYKKEDEKLKASIAIDVQILDQANTDNIIKTNRYDLEVEKEDPDIVYSQDVLKFERRIQVKPGTYKVNFTLIDQNSGKQITGSTQTFIPNPKGDVANLTNIRMLGKDVDVKSNTWSPITTYDVQGKLDSLRFVFQVTNNNSSEPMNVEAQLVKFESDTTIARPMHYNNYSPSTIQYKGIDFDETTVIQSTRRTLNQPGSVLIEFRFPQQERGNYRFEVRTNKSAEEDAKMFKARDFSVKSKNYPSIQSPRELAQPLAYLMDEGDYEDLMAIQDPDSLKQEVDRFWLKHIGNTSKTKQVIKMFYERVEEANKQFSNYKEGWKTDTGMIYILFGPPWYVEQHLDQMIWSYAYNRNDPEYNYQFHQPKLESEFYPFSNFLLRRNQYYFQIQYQQLQLWLSGQILNRSI